MTNSDVHRLAHCRRDTESARGVAKRNRGQEPFKLDVPRTRIQHELPGRPSQSRSKARVVAEQHEELSQAVNVAGLVDKTIDTIGDRARDITNVRRDYGTSAGKV